MKCIGALTAALLVALVALVAPAVAQQEQGDIELQFTGSLVSVVGQTDVSVTAGLFQGKVGYFVTQRMQIGAFPSLMIDRRSTTVQGTRFTRSETKLGLGFFTLYSFLAADATTVPYVGGQFYRIDVTDEDETGWLGVNAGVKLYMSRRTAFDMGGNYLVGLGEAGGSLVLLQVGLSVLF